MPTHIDHVVTEVIPEAQAPQEGGSGDKRWQENMKTEAIIKQSEASSTPTQCWRL